MSNQSIPCIAQTFKAGDKLAGCYTLKELLPYQGFCVVWLANDEELNKDIVLHFIPDSVAADSRAMSELKQEAKRNRQLIHPRIIRVHDLVEDEKWAAISMDYVAGETLAALRSKRDKGAFSPSELASGIAELCQTMEDAHRIELFHRDLTPENLLATSNGVMVQKFGISRVILDSLARAGQKIDASRDIAYISPQQLDGERPSRGDDIYSLGASIFDLLTGTPPFNEGDIVSQIRKTARPLISQRRSARGIQGEETPKAWDETVAACLAKTPEERPKSAADAGSRFASAKTLAGTAAPALADAAATGVAAAEAARTTPPASESPAKTQDKTLQQKRGAAPGPGKTPVIAEATVLSKTDVPKKEPAKETAGSKPAETPAAEAAGSGAGGRKTGATTPTGFPLQAFVPVEGENKRAKGKSHAGLFALGAVILLVLCLSYLVYRNNSASSTDNETAASDTGTNSQVVNNSETTTAPIPVAAASASPAESPATAEASPAPSAPVNLAAAATPASSAPAEPRPAQVMPQPAAAPIMARSATPGEGTGATARSTPPPPPVAAAPTATPTPIPASQLASMTDDQANRILAAKAKAVEQAKAALAAAEKTSQDSAAARANATSALQSLQDQIKQKADASAAAKKAADAAAATFKQQQESLQKAQADADAAQKAAAAKVQAAQALQKTIQEAQAAAQKQQAAAQQADADAAQLSKTVADRQKAAADAAKAADAAEKARLQQAQAVAAAQADLDRTQQSITQAQLAEKARAAAAQDAARIAKQREAAAQLQKQRLEEAQRLAVQAAAAAKAAADAQKALAAAQKAVADAEKAQAAAEAQAAAARNGSLPVSLPANPAATPMASPAAAATPMASPAATAAPSANAPTLSVRAPNPHLKVDQALSNSLGMRFAPVGKVLFSIWLTRVQDFTAFAQATGFKSNAWQDPGFKQGPDHPVVNVSWNDANQFCLWLTQKEHHAGILPANETYRLPTDLEWSAAVGLPPEVGHTPESRDMDIPDVYPWGTQWPPPAGAGNYTGEETDSDVAIKGYNDGFAWTSPVGSFSANKFGLYDMGGNVWEWCMDWWNSDQKQKVLRGASWYNGALKLSLLSSCRNQASADLRSDNYGFRVVISPEAGKPATRGRHHTD